MVFTAITSMLILSHSPQGRPGQALIGSSWHDEMNHPSDWKHLAIGNKPSLGYYLPGKLKLTLGRVPSDWPYQYQWSGVTRRAEVDIARGPFLSAYVPEVNGYAHLDVDVLSDSGKVLKTFRSSTLQSPGVCTLDLSNSVMAGTYTFQIRLIVGGPNSGCSATYDWVRFSSVKDGERMKAHPELRIWPESNGHHY